MRKLLLLLTFFTITPAFLIFLAVFLSYTDFQSSHRPLALTDGPQQVSYAALPTSQGVLGASVDLTDRRVTSLQTFFAKYNSPLLDYAGLIVEKADEYNIDYRLLPAIAMQESLLCKKATPGSYNCWGFGIYGKKRTSFSSYPDAIDTITRYFAKKKSNGVDTLEEIGNIYNPTNYNDWKGKVSMVMSKL